jgi:hypothetical protein
MTLVIPAFHPAAQRRRAPPASSSIVDSPRKRFSTISVV